MNLVFRIHNNTILNLLKFILIIHLSKNDSKIENNALLT
jgi:hypothetical protein